ncbi:MAG TPA: peroxiredoxin family protein [Planctomycetota bacterium]|nr:peroxiredoxin family protein [Planctomycetota bacterium]
MKSPLPFAFAALLLISLCTPSIRADGDDEDPKNPSGHSTHGDAFNEGPRQAAYLMDGMPNVHFQVTHSVEDAQKFFDQGVGQLHGFWYFEAERSFRQALKIDPKCVMAYWGMARANVNNMERGRGFIGKAVERKGEVTKREQMWIESTAAYYRYGVPKDQKDDSKARRKEFVRAFENIIEQFPDDIEAKAFLVLQIWDNQGEWPIVSRMSVDALAREVLAVNPMHPIHHYRVHLWDSSEARMSLDSAALCGQSGPGIAHLWHMPGGHMYTPVKRYRDAVWQQEASNRVDHFHMIHDGVMPDLIHNYAHNSNWLSQNLCFLGRVRPALEIAEDLDEMPRHPRYNTLTLAKSQPGYNAGNASAKLARERLLEIPVRFELWDDLLRLDATGHLDETGDALTDTRVLRTLALAHYFKKDIAGGDAPVRQISEQYRVLAEERHAAAAEAEAKAAADKKADAAKARDDALHSSSDTLAKISDRLDELKVVRLFAEGNFKDVLAKFSKLDALPRELKIRLRFEAGDKDEAEKQARQFAKEGINQVPPLAVLADILWRNNKQDEAKETFKKMRDLDGLMDLDAPMFARLKPIAQALNLPADWRVLPPEAKDVGVRPPLDKLGPFLWKPSPAPSFALPGPGDRPMSLSEFRGRPVVLMFFLGHSCVHCIEQLNAFAPAYERFAQSGIAMAAIGTDPPENVGKTLAKAKLSGGFPFPILSDPSKNVFKQYRAFDDFENMPLHGTFLLDKDGKIVWQDIGYEPFTNVEFLLSEARRLLSIKRTAL